jgi:hypothetical protein
MFARLLIILAALLAPASAQTESPPGKARDIQVKLLAEQFPEKLGKVYLQFEETRSEPFALPVNRLSDPVTAEGRAMVLKLEDKDLALCKIALPETGKSFAVVLVTAKPAGFKPIVVRTDDPTFRAGDVLFINRSEKTILGKLGRTPLVLKAGQTAKSRPTGAVENTYYDISFATREGNEDKLISSSRWPVEQDLRSYLFFFTSSKGRTTFRAVDEYLPSRAAEN